MKGREAQVLPSVVDSQLCWLPLAPINIAVLIDGKIAGVFGVDKAALTLLGAFGTQVSDALFLMYGMTVTTYQVSAGKIVDYVWLRTENLYIRYAQIWRKKRSDV